MPGTRTVPVLTPSMTSSRPHGWCFPKKSQLHSSLNSANPMFAQGYLISIQANMAKAELFFCPSRWSVSSVGLSCLTLCDPRDCSTPGFPVHHQLLELAQTHVYWVDDVIQPSHPLSSPSPPVFSLSQHQGLFQWVSSSHQVAKGLKCQLPHQSF